jgi:ferredoxin-NADP reductase
METEVAIPNTSDRTLHLFVRQIRFEGKGIHSYEFVDPEGRDLPRFDAGAHIDIHLADGLIRQYSLCNAPDDRKRYVIAVLRDEKGRGGSKAVHEHVHVQDTVLVSRPRNNFALVDDAKKVILLAGGIGVTPLKAMAHALEARGIDYELHYCARDATCAAFTEAFDTLSENARVHYHFDGGDPSAGLDFQGLLREPRQGTHVYYCGPGGFMKACANATGHWPAGTVHFEHFKAPERPVAPALNGAAKQGATEVASETAGDVAGAFDLKIQSTGQMIVVKPDQSIAEALEEAGVVIETSCRAGLCGTCKVRYLSGEVEHNDCILNDDEKGEFLTTCVSRATSRLLVLDL